MKKIALLLIFIMVFLLCSCEQGEKKFSSTQVMMTTVVTVTVYTDDESILNGAMELCRYYENMFSRTVENSDIYNINHSGGLAVEVDKQTVELLNIARDISIKSEGAFDVTITPLTELWSISERTVPPTEAEVSEALKKVNYQNILTDISSVTAASGATVDLGGIAKGYIADKIKEYIVSKGVTRGTINLGGNVVLIGDNGGKPYNVGIREPFESADSIKLMVELSDKTAVTSGIYERYFRHEGSLYHHIIDTKTGHPVDNNVASVTVIADSSAIADGLSTACLVLGTEKGTALASSYGAETVFILKDGSVVVSDGLKIHNQNEIPCINMK